MEQEKKDLQALKEKGSTKFKHTFKLSRRFQESIELRNYINTFEKYALESNFLTDEKQHWIQWARKKADWYDPFIDAEDDLLDDIDKDTLTFKKTN